LCRRGKSKKQKTGKRRRCIGKRQENDINSLHCWEIRLGACTSHPFPSIRTDIIARMRVQQRDSGNSLGLAGALKPSHGPRPIPRPRNIKCPVMNYRYHRIGFPDRTALRRHTGAIHPPMSYCCPYKSKRPGNMPVHKDKDHLGPPP
jgi:hypothetical protein